MLSARRQERLDALARELVGSQVIPADLSRRGEAERLAAATGAVDVLVANAGLPASGELLSFSIEELDRALEVNLRAPMVLTRCLLGGMVERGWGRVVLMASMAGQVAAARMPIYAATKFGLRGFGHALRAELRGTGVKVALVSPFFVSKTGMWAETGQRARGEVSPEQVAAAVIRALQGRRSELTVAPPGLGLLRRLPMAFPEIVHGVAGAAAVFPEEAVARQRAKR